MRIVIVCVIIVDLGNDDVGVDTVACGNCQECYRCTCTLSCDVAIEENDDLTS